MRERYQEGTGDVLCYSDVMMLQEHLVDKRWRRMTPLKKAAMLKELWTK